MFRNDVTCGDFQNKNADIVPLKTQGSTFAPERDIVIDADASSSQSQSSTMTRRVRHNLS